MISNAIFYTFSTIAQALAGAIALLGAFVLYSLQSRRTQIHDDSLRVSTGYGVNVVGYDPGIASAISSLHHAGKYREVLDYALRTPLPPNAYAAEIERSRLSLNLERQDDILKAFNVSLLLTVGLIFTSVVILAAAPRIVACPAGPTVLFALGIVWFGACLVSYVLLVRRSIT